MSDSNIQQNEILTQLPNNCMIKVIKNNSDVDLYSRDKQEKNIIVVINDKEYYFDFTESIIAISEITLLKNNGRVIYTRPNQGMTDSSDYCDAKNTSPFIDVIFNGNKLAYFHLCNDSDYYDRMDKIMMDNIMVNFNKVDLEIAELKNKIAELKEQIIDAFDRIDNCENRY
jgi:hypothetical protein